MGCTDEGHPELTARARVGMQSLVALFAGRVFNYQQRFLSMPAVMLWLTLSAVLGIAIGVGRGVIVMRRSAG